MILTTCKYFDLVGNRCSRVTDGKCNDLQDCEFKYIAELKAENETYKANADAVQKCITQNEQLKTYISGLEKKNAKLNAIIDSYQPRLQKYKDILQEIKEIAGFHITDEDCEDVQNDMEQIIDLITKEEEE